MDKYKDSKESSVIFKSLCRAMKKHLVEYTRWIAMMETQLAKPEAASELTLRRMYIWAQEP